MAQTMCRNFGYEGHDMVRNSVGAGIEGVCIGMERGPGTPCSLIFALLYPVYGAGRNRFGSFNFRTEFRFKLHSRQMVNRRCPPSV